MNLFHILFFFGFSIANAHHSLAGETGDELPETNIHFKQAYNSLFRSYRFENDTSVNYTTRELRNLLIELRDNFPDGAESYEQLTKEKLMELIDAGYFSEAQCTPETYNYRLHPTLDWLYYLNSMKHPYHTVQMFHDYLDGCDRQRLLVCIQLLAKKLDDSLDYSEVSYIEVIEFIKNIFFNVTSSDTWTKVSGGSESVTYEVAINNLIKLIGVKKTFDFKKYSERLQSSLGNLKINELFKGVEPLVINTLDVINILPLIRRFEYTNEVNSQLAQTTIDLLTDVDFCQNLFQNQVHPILMALCLLNKHSKLIEEAQKDKIPERYPQNELAAKYTFQWGEIHDKYKSDIEKIRNRFFKFSLHTYKPKDTLWFLKRLRELYVVDDGQKDSHQKPTIEEIERLIELSELKDSKCQKRTFPSLSTFLLEKSVADYVNWCKKEQRLLCLKKFDDDFKMASKEISENELNNLLVAKAVAFENVPNFYLDKIEQISGNKMEKALLSYMEQHLSSPELYTGDFVQFELEMDNSLKKICQVDMIGVNEITSTMFDLFHHYDDLSKNLSNEAIDLIGIVSLCKRYFVDSERLKQQVARDFDSKYPRVKRVTSNVLNKCGLGGCIGKGKN